MSHYYGKLHGSRKNPATSCGTKKTGIIARAMSYAGEVNVSMSYSEKRGDDLVWIEVKEHEDRGGNSCQSLNAIPLAELTLGIKRLEALTQEEWEAVKAMRGE